MSAKVLDGAVKTDKGIELNGMVISPIVEQCAGCDRVRTFEEQSFCSSYPTPSRKWTAGKCNFATHIKAAGNGGAKTNPLKASKRAAKGK